MGYQIVWMGESDSAMLEPQEYFLIKGKHILIPYSIYVY